MPCKEVRLPSASMLASRLRASHSASSSSHPERLSTGRRPLRQGTIAWIPRPLVPLTSWCGLLATILLTLTARAAASLTAKLGGMVGTHQTESGANQIPNLQLKTFNLSLSMLKLCSKANTTFLSVLWSFSPGLAYHRTRDG